MKKITFGKRIRYWLERNMSKGTSSMIKLLLAVVLFMAILVTVLVIVFHLADGKNVIALLWDNLRAAMSSSFPASNSGSPLYVVLYTLLGLTGMIYTSMLISIFSTSMRGKLLALQTENPHILEKGHVVVLGFRSGEYALLEQLMISAGKEKRTIVVVDVKSRVDMEQDIRTNVNVPKNIRLVTINSSTEITAELECCNIPSASRVIICNRNAGKTIKTYLAVNTLLKDAEQRPKIIAAVDASADAFPEDIVSDGEISILRSSNVVARLIAHAATQPGIFPAFLEMIDFTGFEFYFEDIPDACGLPYWKVALALVNGIAVGLYREGKLLLNPDIDTPVLHGDLLVVFEEEQGNAKLERPEEVTMPEKKSLPSLQPIPEVAILGVNDSLPTVIEELPDNVERIRLAGLTTSEYAKYFHEGESFASEIIPDYRNADSEETLEDMVKDATHVIVLSDPKKREEDADTDTMVRIIRLRNLKKKLGLHFSITAEMRCENNRKLISESGSEDVVVASDMSAMMLAQVAEDPRRLGLFNELLDEQGCEVYLKPLADFGISETKMTVREFRSNIYAYGYTPLGIRTREGSFQVLDDNVSIQPKSGDCLVLIGEE